MILKNRNKNDLNFFLLNERKEQKELDDNNDFW
jgi:hypothetical protein